MEMTVISLLIATATAIADPIDVQDPNWWNEVSASLSEPDVYIDDDWYLLDVAAAPEGRVVYTLEQSCDPRSCESAAFRLSARVDGVIVHTIEIKGDYADLIAIDHFRAETGLDVFVVAAEHNLLYALAFVSEVQVGFMQILDVAPGPIIQPLDIAAGNDRVYLLGLTADDGLSLMSWDLAVWNSVVPFGMGYKPGEPRGPAIDLDRTRDRLTVAVKDELIHYAPDLRPVGECQIVTDQQAPHLGREFAVEDGVLIYVNYTSRAHEGAVLEHRTHIAEADNCASLDVLDSSQTYTMHIHTGALNAMSIEPQPKSEFWPVSQSPKPHVKAWTTLRLSNYVPIDEAWVSSGSGIFLTEGRMIRPFL